MRRTVIVGMLALSLASCTTTQLQESLASFCSGGETAFAVLEPFIIAGKLKPRTEAAAVAAHDNLTMLCANKETATPTSVLVAASPAVLTISTALREAKRGE